MLVGPGHADLDRHAMPRARSRLSQPTTALGRKRELADDVQLAGRPRAPRRSFRRAPLPCDRRGMRDGLPDSRRCRSPRCRLLASGRFWITASASANGPRCIDVAADHQAAGAHRLRRAGRASKSCKPAARANAPRRDMRRPARSRTCAADAAAAMQLGRLCRRHRRDIDRRAARQAAPPSPAISAALGRVASSENLRAKLSASCAVRMSCPTTGPLRDHAPTRAGGRSRRIRRRTTGRRVSAARRAWPRYSGGRCCTSDSRSSSICAT